MNRSTRFAVATALALLGLALLGGAQASVSTGCNPEGRAICITIEDVDHVTHSTTELKRYTSYTVGVRNDGRSALTNGSAAVELKDVVAGQEATATAAFVSVPAGCTSASATSFTCPLANIPASTDAPVIGPFFASTSTDPAATHTRLKVTVTVKEKASDNEGGSAQPDTFTWHEDTILEPEPDASRSVVFFGGSTLLETSPGHRGQSSVFRVPVVASFAGFELATLQELSPGEAGYFCPAGFACFGQSVATSAPAVFSEDNLANLVSTVDLSLLPRGVTVRTLRVHHDDFSFTTACSGPLFETPAESEVPCRRVQIDRQAGIVVIDVWDNHQGDWGFS